MYLSTHSLLEKAILEFVAMFCAKIGCLFVVVASSVKALLVCTFSSDTITRTEYNLIIKVKFY